MSAFLTAALMTAAEISNLFSVVGVIVCFLCMVVFILRLQGEDLFGTSVVHVAQPPVVRVAYQKVHIPFSLELHRPGDATYYDVQLKVWSEVSYSLHSFWGVSSPHLHSVMAAPWSTFFTSLLGEENCEVEKQGEVEEEQLEGAKVQEVEERQGVEETLRAQVADDVVREDLGETVKRVGLASSSPPPSLGPSPRTTYPLVVCVLRQEIPGEGEDPSGVGALINIIHIKDPDCQIPTCVLHQYLKQYSGQLTKLQALYTQGNNSDERRAGRRATDGRRENEQKDEEEEEEKQEQEQTIKTKQEQEQMKQEQRESIKQEDEEEEIISLEEACVVCQIKRTTRALLPCRHVCTCDTCFSRLDTCPMCRTPIRAYFLVGPEMPGEEGAGEGEGQHVPEHTQTPMIWRRIGGAVARVLRGHQNIWRGVQW